MRLQTVVPLMAFGFSLCAQTHALPKGQAIQAAVQKVMMKTHAQGLAVALIDHGKVSYVRAFGTRNAKGEPLTTGTVMYGASLTKTVFAYTVLQLVDQGKLTLDTPIKDLLGKPLPSYGRDPVFPDKYGPYPDLAGDPRWAKITPRMVLTHSTGFLNFFFLEPDQKLRIHFEPGSRYSYSGEGMILLQFVIEHGRKDHGVGLDVGALTQSTFNRLGMSNTSLVWRPSFASNLADGWDDKGRVELHDRRSKVRAAGSMDTTIADLAKFAAALMRGDGLSARARTELSKRQLKITTAHQFPASQPELPAAQQRTDLYAGLGVISLRRAPGSRLLQRRP